MAADAFPLVGRVDEKRGEEPAVAPDERGGEADDAAVVCGDERALAVVGEDVPVDLCPPAARIEWSRRPGNAAALVQLDLGGDEDRELVGEVSLGRMSVLDGRSVHAGLPSITLQGRDSSGRTQVSWKPACA